MADRDAIWVFQYLRVKPIDTITLVRDVSAVLGAGLDRISREQQQAILTAFPRLGFKDGFKRCLCKVVRQKPMSVVDNILRDFGIRYVQGFTPRNFADLVAGALFSE